MQQLFSGRIFYEGAANSLLASLTGAGLAVTLVLAALILAAAVFAVISIVRRRKKNKGRCPGCGGACSSCGTNCPKDRDPGSSTGGTADSIMQTKSVPSSLLSDNNKSGKQ